MIVTEHAMSRRSSAMPTRSRSAALLDQYVGARLKQIRTESGVEIWQMAQKLGLRIDVLVDYEGGRTRISPRTLAEFARVFGISTRYFFEGYLDNRTW